jgi:acyl-CoA dehydrogenase
MIADSWSEIEQFRLLVFADCVADRPVRQLPAGPTDISAVKAAMPKVLHDVASQALQIHGSLGISDEIPFGDMVLESFRMGLADGATEVHKVTLARQLLAGNKASDDLFPIMHLLRLESRRSGGTADALSEVRSATRVGALTASL